jgi:cytochrome P450
MSEQYGCLVELQERWLEPGAENLVVESKEGTRSCKRFIPFGEGMRSCLGQNLAVIVMRAILAHLLGRFEFKLSGQVIN